MQIKIGLPKRFEHLNETANSRIPTRFDDIQKEILMDRVKDYFQQKSPVDVTGQTTYRLGDVIGEKLNEII